MRRIILALVLSVALLSATTSATAATPSTYQAMDIPCIIGCY